jgi:HSP20 family protein
MSRKPSFFERLTGSFPADDFENDFDEAFVDEEPATVTVQESPEQSTNWTEEVEGELSVDVHQTRDSIVIKAIVAGIRPDDIDVAITREMVTIKGRRDADKTVHGDDFFHQELYWGSFSRTILLPEEVDPDGAEAMSKHGLLIITLPKLDVKRQTRVRVKSS